MDVISMFKRLNIYYKEMFPLIPRIMLGVIIFGEIYFIILLNYGITDFKLGIYSLFILYVPQDCR